MYNESEMPIPELPNNSISRELSQEAFLVALKRCGVIKVARDAAAIPEKQLRAWLTEGSDRYEPTFARRVAETMAEDIMEAVEAIKEAGKKDWRAKAWALVNCYPDLFGERAALLKQLEALGVGEVADLDVTKQSKVGHNRA
jgi:hypothetical protein